MIAFLSFEWFKLRKRRMPWIILALILALTILAFWGQATRGDGRPNLFLPRGWLAALSFCSFFAPFFWPVLAGSWAGNEYGWGTIRAVLTRRPNRITHVLAALVVLLAALVAALLAILVVASVAGIVVSLATGNGVFTSGILSGDFLLVLLKGLLTAWYVSAFFLLIAYVAAVMFRSAAVGIGFGVGSTLAQFVLQRILGDLGGTWKTIADHFPVVYANYMITQVVWSQLVPGTNLASVSPNAPSAGQSLLALAIYAVIALALMLGAVRARDITA
ncbi:MAG TPA: ABC transporter permease [Chloroflexota bacterium]|nr:ABC transporter permease [Chloroflexota bacterium]